MKLIKIKIVILMIFAGTMLASAQSFTIIVNSANSNSSISKSDASAFFLKKKTKWADGTVVLPVDQSSSSSVRSSFSNIIHGKSVSNIRAYWQQAVFAGKGTPPSELKSDTEVIEYVKTHKGAIGYISSSTNASGVKVITIK